MVTTVLILSSRTCGQEVPGEPPQNFLQPHARRAVDPMAQDLHQDGADHHDPSPPALRVVVLPDGRSVYVPAPQGRHVAA